MKMLLAKLWQRITGRSAPSAAPPAVPYIPPNPAGPVAWSSSGLPIQPLERNVEVRAVSGLQNELGHMERRYRGADGEMIRYYEDRRSLIAGCGHHVMAASLEGAPQKSPRHREIAGLCAYCLREYQGLVAKGQMDPLEAERLSLVCTECAQMSTSGHLCCPRHRKTAVTPDGTTQYIDPDTAKSMARQNTIAKALHTVTWLLAETPHTQEHKPTDQE